MVIISDGENPRAEANREVADDPSGRPARPIGSDVRARDRLNRRARIIARDPRVPPAIVDPARSVARDRATENARDRAHAAAEVTPDRRPPTIVESGVHRDRDRGRENPDRVPETGGGTVDRAANRRA